MNKYIKLGITAIMIAFAIYLFTEREIGWGITLIVLSAIPVLLFFRNEYILLAFWQMRTQKIDKAKFWLSKIKNPEKQLVRKQMGYYHFMLGLTESQTNLNAAEKYMKKALDYGLSFAHDRAMATLSLAGAAMSRGKKNEAGILLKEAKRLDKNNMLAEQIKMMNEQMKKINIGKNLHNPHVRNRGKYF